MKPFILVIVLVIVILVAVILVLVFKSKAFKSKAFGCKAFRKKDNRMFRNNEISMMNRVVNNGPEIIKTSFPKDYDRRSPTEFSLLTDNGMINDIDVTQLGVHNYVVPDGKTMCDVEIIAGGSGGDVGDQGNGGAGGSGGGYVKIVQLPVVPGTKYIVRLANAIHNPGLGAEQPGNEFKQAENGPSIFVTGLSKDDIVAVGGVGGYEEDAGKGGDVRYGTISVRGGIPDDTRHDIPGKEPETIIVGNATIIGGGAGGYGEMFGEHGGNGQGSQQYPDAGRGSSAGAGGGGNCAMYIGQDGGREGSIPSGPIGDGAGGGGAGDSRDDSLLIPGGNGGIGRARLRFY